MTPTALRVAVFAVCVLAGNARAGQYLVAPGDRWDTVLAAASPGDEIILMPGEHRAVSVDKAGGSETRPVTVRSLNPGEPIVINAERVGVQLKEARHLVFRDITINGASIAGIDIGYAEAPRPADSDPAVIGLTLERVTITRTGPRGYRHAVALCGARDVSISKCTFDSWGGAAVSVIDSQRVRISDCTFTAGEGFTQFAGVAIRGGSEACSVTGCTFSAGTRTQVELGANSKHTWWDAAEPAPAIGEIDATADGTEPPAARWEARSIVVERNRINGGLVAFTIASAAELEIRTNTIHATEEAVVRVDPDRDRRMTGPRACTFDANLVVVGAMDVHRIELAADDVDLEEFEIGENLWWSDPALEDGAAWPPLVGRIVFPQIENLDPGLDDGRPRSKQP